VGKTRQPLKTKKRKHKQEQEDGEITGRQRGQESPRKKMQSHATDGREKKKLRGTYSWEGKGEKKGRKTKEQIEALLARVRHELKGASIQVKSNE